MRKIDLKDYQFDTKVPSRELGAPAIEVSLPYPVKDSILNMLFIKELRLSGAELVKQNALALKIEACKEDEIIVDDIEYTRIKTAFDTFTGYGRQDLELVERINSAPTV